ncbi:MAG: RrF2 family transcriptional regulator [Paludibacteraceae bacterium]|nr:RrF2 family transcriptional regulator [Paludibacteraceae bacterium]
MMISTKGRYAIRVMLDLAEHNTSDYIRLKDISARQGISQKYLESITATLSKSGLIDGAHGKGGGYRLKRSPEQYTIGEILRLMEGPLAPVACLGCEVNTCENKASCRTLPMWEKLYKMVNDFFDDITIADLAKEGADDGFFGACL